MVEDGIVFYQPVDIVVLDSFTIISNGITIDRYQIQTPGSYSFQLSQPNLESGFNQTVSFKVVIYNTDTAYLLLFFSIVPMVLFLLSLRRAHHDIIQ